MLWKNSNRSPTDRIESVAISSHQALSLRRAGQLPSINIASAQSIGLITSLVVGSHKDITVVPQTLASTLSRTIAKSINTVSAQQIVLPTFRPSQLTTLVGWWDASDSTTLTDAGSGHCSQWNDKSSNANHVTQATDAQRPVITASGINGLTTLTFTAASTQFFEKLTLTGMPNLTTGISCGVMMKSLSANNHALWDISATTLTNSTAFLSQLANTIQLRSQNANASSKAFTDTTSAHIFSGSISTALRDVYVDGVQGTPNSTSQSSLASTNLRIGCLFQNTEPMSGQIAEVVLFSGASSTERQKVEGYLAWKWGTVSSLSGGHPYKLVPP